VDSIVFGFDGLQSAGVDNAVNAVSTALDVLMDCVEISAGVDPSTAPIELQVIAEQCLFCDDDEFMNVADCQKSYKRELK
jgi:hypothetical protein